MEYGFIPKSEGGFQREAVLGVWDPATPSVAQGPAAWASPGSFLEMQSLRSRPRASESESVVRTSTGVCVHVRVRDAGRPHRPSILVDAF